MIIVDGKAASGRWLLSDAFFAIDFPACRSWIGAGLRGWGPIRHRGFVILGEGESSVLALVSAQYVGVSL